MNMTKEKRDALAKVFEDALIEYINDTCLDDVHSLAYDVVRTSVDESISDSDFADLVVELVGGITVRV